MFFDKRGIRKLEGCESIQMSWGWRNGKATKKSERREKGVEMETKVYLILKRGKEKDKEI